MDPVCSCGSGIELTIHFFLDCAEFNTERQNPFDKMATIDANILTDNEGRIVNALLFRKENSEKSFNKATLNLFYQLGGLMIHYFNAN